MKFFFLKILLICLAPALFVYAGTHFQQEKKQGVWALAQISGNIETELGGEYYTNLTCNEPIPLGEAIEDTQQLISDILTQYQIAKSQLDIGINALQRELATLYTSPLEVCDFSKCKAEVIDKGLSANVDAAGIGNILGVHVANCEPQKCTDEGGPCPIEIIFGGEQKDEQDKKIKIDGINKEIELSKSAIASSHTIIKDIFNKVIDAPIPADLRYSAESADNKITRPQLIERKVQLVREWLSPSLDMKSCAMSSLERKLYDEGKIGGRFPMRCVEALEQELYWPKLSSVECEDDCSKISSKSGFSKCLECLKKAGGKAGGSSLAIINNKMYGVCQTSCEEKDAKGNTTGNWKLTEECLDCVCKYPGIASGSMTEEQCISFMCSGSYANRGGYYNWVCCYEDVPAQIDIKDYQFDTAVYDEKGKFQITAYGPTTNRESNICANFCRGRCTAAWWKDNAPGATFGIIAVDDDKYLLDGKTPNPGYIPLGSKVKIILGSITENNKVVNDPLPDPIEKIKNGDENKEKVNVFSEVFCACDTGGVIKGQHIDMWLPTQDLAKNWGSKYGNLEISYNPNDNCCKTLRPRPCVRDTYSKGGTCLNSRCSKSDGLGW